MNGSKIKGGSLLMTSLVLVTVLCCFQNCSPAGVQFNGESVLTSKGNGDIYGGKTYVLTLDDGQCLDGTKLDSVISEQDKKYLLLRDQCQDLDPAVEIPDEEIQLLPEGLVYQDRLYINQEHSVENGESVSSDSISDLWCIKTIKNERTLDNWIIHVQARNGEAFNLVSLTKRNIHEDIMYLRQMDMAFFSAGPYTIYLQGTINQGHGLGRMVGDIVRLQITGRGGQLSADLILGRTQLSPSSSPIPSLEDALCQTEGEFFSRLVQPTNQPQEPKRPPQ